MSGFGKDPGRVRPGELAKVSIIESDANVDEAVTILAIFIPPSDLGLGLRLRRLNRALVRTGARVCLHGSKRSRRRNDQC